MAWDKAAVIAYVLLCCLAGGYIVVLGTRELRRPAAPGRVPLDLEAINRAHEDWRERHREDIAEGVRRGMELAREAAA